MSGSSYLILSGQIVNSRRFAHVPERALEPRLPVPFGEASRLCTWGCVCVLKGEIWGCFVQQVLASPWRKSTSAGKDVSGVLQLYCRGGYKISPRGFIEPYALADLDSATPVGPSSSPGILQKVRTASSPRRGLPTRSYSVPVQSAILASVDTDTVAD
jgi:hypothetical protein